MLKFTDRQEHSGNASRISRLSETRVYPLFLEIITREDSTRIPQGRNETNGHLISVLLLTTDRYADSCRRLIPCRCYSRSGARFAKANERSAGVTRTLDHAGCHCRSCCRAARSRVRLVKFFGRSMNGTLPRVCEIVRSLVTEGSPIAARSVLGSPFKWRIKSGIETPSALVFRMDWWIDRDASSRGFFPRASDIVTIGERKTAESIPGPRESASWREGAIATGQLYLEIDSHQHCLCPSAFSRARTMKRGNKKKRKKRWMPII